MPTTNVKTSKILSKIANRAKGGWKKSKKRQAQPKGARVPGGIVGGTARLKAYKIDAYEARAKSNGRPATPEVPYVQMSFTVLTPEEHQGKTINVTVRLQENERKTYQECLDDVANNLKLLGDDFEAMVDASDGPADWPEILEAAVKAKPCIEFNSTDWEFNNQKGTSYFIQGPAEDAGEVEEEEPEEEEEDKEEGASLDDMDRAELKAYIKAEGLDVKVTKGMDDDAIRAAIMELVGETEEPEDEEEEEEEAEDEAEDEGDEEESEDETEEETEDEEEETEEATVPVKDDVFGYKPKGAKKAANMTVTSVNQKKETVTLKSDAGKTYKDVPWSDLLNAE